MISACQACGQPLVWAAHEETGKLAPICAEPTADGNLLVWRAWPPGQQPALRYTALGEELRAKLAERGVPLRLNHFADCPQAERFRPGVPAEAERTVGE